MTSGSWDSKAYGFTSKHSLATCYGWSDLGRTFPGSLFLQNDIKTLTDCEVMRKFYLKQSDRSGEKEYSVKIDSGRMNEGT